jgi:hypothetical protein
MNSANTAWVLSDDNKVKCGGVFTHCCLWRILVFVVVVVVVLAAVLVVLVLVLVLVEVAVVEEALVVMMMVVVMVVDSLPLRRISDSCTSCKFVSYQRHRCSPDEQSQPRWPDSNPTLCALKSMYIGAKTKLYNYHWWRMQVRVCRFETARLTVK